MAKRVFVIVLDSLGIGEAPDAARYQDQGSNTLASIAKSRRFAVPNLAKLGLFGIDGVACAQADPNPTGAVARLQEKSAGKDTVTGHWEMAGLITQTPFPTYPDGFPPEIIAELERRFGRAILCNKPYSGTKVIEDYGREHMETGALIVYTSADSVLQIAAHEQVVPLAELYQYCKTAREVMSGKHAIGRIIARPFVGDYPHFTRTANRHDYALAPTGTTLLDTLVAAGRTVIGIGKISDIFAGRSVPDARTTKSNADGMEKTLAAAQEDFEGLCFVNLVDFDSIFGHRNDVDGYANAVSEFDAWLPRLFPLLGPEDLVFLTADHGCDPATPSTDHSREYVPLIAFGHPVRAGANLGTRGTFADLAATIQAYFGLPLQTQGSSFLPEILSGPRLS
jgi:phosphopentomutase